MVAFVVLQFYFYIQLTWYAYWNKMYYNIVYITVNSEKKISMQKYYFLILY